MYIHGLVDSISSLSFFYITICLSNWDSLVCVVSFIFVYKWRICFIHIHPQFYFRASLLCMCVCWFSFSISWIFRGHPFFPTFSLQFLICSIILQIKSGFHADRVSIWNCAVGTIRCVVVAFIHFLFWIFHYYLFWFVCALPISSRSLHFLYDFFLFYFPFCLINVIRFTY